MENLCLNSPRSAAVVTHFSHTCLSWSHSHLRGAGTRVHRLLGQSSTKQLPLPPPRSAGLLPSETPRAAQPRANTLGSGIFFSACGARQLPKLLQRKPLALSCPACSRHTVRRVRLPPEIILRVLGLWKVAPTFLTVVKAKVMSGLLKIFLLLETPKRLSLQDLCTTSCHRLAKIFVMSECTSFSKLRNNVRILFYFK